VTWLIFNHTSDDRSNRPADARVASAIRNRSDP
jgi:hypothetical protein